MSSLVIENEFGIITHRAKKYIATSLHEIAFKNTDLIFVTVSAFCMKKAAEIMLPYTPCIKICLVPGTGGGEWAFNDCIKKRSCVVWSAESSLCCKGCGDSKKYSGTLQTRYSKVFRQGQRENQHD